MRLDLHELFEKVDIPENLEKADEKILIDELSLMKKIDKKMDNEIDERSNIIIRFYDRHGKRGVAIAASVLVLISAGILGKNILFKDDTDNIDNRNIAREEKRKEADKKTKKDSDKDKAEEKDKSDPKDKTDKPDSKDNGRGTGIIPKQDSTPNKTNRADNSGQSKVDIKDSTSTPGDSTVSDSGQSNGGKPTEGTGFGPGAGSTPDTGTIPDIGSDSELHPESGTDDSIKPETGGYPQDIVSLFASNGWQIDRVGDTKTTTLPVSFEYNPELDLVQYYYIFMNNLSRDSGYDYSMYAGQALLEESYSVVSGGNRYVARVLRTDSGQIAGVFMEDSNNILNSKSLYGRNIYQILGEGAQQWIDYYQN